MSSRYGRQKKRKAAEAIKALRYENSGLKRERSASKELMSDCIRVLGANFIGLPAQTINSSIYGDYLRVPQRPLEQSVGYISGRDLVNHLACMVHEVGVMRSEVQHDKLQQAVHFRIRHPETGEISYCASREAMEDMPRDILIKRISTEIAEQFSRALSSQPKGEKK